MADSDFTGNFNIGIVRYLLPGVTFVEISGKDSFFSDTRMYFAVTSELFGQSKETQQTEMPPFFPRSPYAVSKLAGFWTVRTYREAYKLFMSNGILFNHESEVRRPEFVTRKISKFVAKIYLGSKEPIVLGNLSAVKDWDTLRIM